MKLAWTQIELLRQSAKDPGRRVSRRADDTLTSDEKQILNVPTNAADASAAALLVVKDAAHAASPSAPPVLSVPPDKEMTVPVREWRPITTAPVLCNVEIMVEDLMGPYKLISPCRFIPGTGWVNALSMKPLGVIPIEWRDWIEPFPELRSGSWLSRAAD